MSNTPITDKIIKQHSHPSSWGEVLDVSKVTEEMRKLELAANKLYAQLSIWANTASDVSGYANIGDIEALAEFELLRKP